VRFSRNLVNILRDRWRQSVVNFWTGRKFDTDAVAAILRHDCAILCLCNCSHFKLLLIFHQWDLAETSQEWSWDDADQVLLFLGWHKIQYAMATILKNTFLTSQALPVQFSWNSVNMLRDWCFITRWAIQALWSSCYGKAFLNVC